MSGPTIIALVCPDCGAQLAGLRYDKVFFCNACRHGLLPDPQKQWVRYPLAVAKLDSPPQAAIVYLPFWQINIEAFSQPVNRQQEVASRLLPNLTSVWATGFIMNRAGYFGDLGLLYTEKTVRPEEAEALPHGTIIAGCARTPEDAGKYVRLYVTLILDKHADVTGMDIKIVTYDARLWAIPFADHGDKIMDLITLHEFPAFSLDDLEAMRKLNNK